MILCRDSTERDTVVGRLIGLTTSRINLPTTVSLIEVSSDEKTIREVLLGDRGAEPSERTDDRRGYRNGGCERTLTTRIGQLKLEIPRDAIERVLSALSCSSDSSVQRRRW